MLFCKIKNGEERERGVERESGDIPMKVSEVIDVGTQLNNILGHKGLHLFILSLCLYIYIIIIFIIIISIFNQIVLRKRGVSLSLFACKDSSSNGNLCVLLGKSPVSRSFK